ncbi:MAG: cytochrome c [Pseudomonadota bacterium]
MRTALIAAAVAASSALSLAMLSFAETPPEQESTAAAQDEGAASFSRGAKAWADNCSRCHTMRDPKELDDVQWKIVMTHMRLRAGLDGGQARDIRRFLQESN